MRLCSVLQHCKLSLLIVCLWEALVGGQVQQDSSNNFDQAFQMSQKLPAEVDTPLTRKLSSSLNNDPPTTAAPDLTSEAPVTRMPFLKAFVRQLEQREAKNETTQSTADHLTLTLNDGLFSLVNIEFVPSNSTPEQKKGWNKIVELLADALAFVVEEAKKQGYNSYFKYGIEIVDELRGFSDRAPDLGGNTLKILVG